MNQPSKSRTAIAAIALCLGASAHAGHPSESLFTLQDSRPMLSLQHPALQDASPAAATDEAVFSGDSSRWRADLYTWIWLLGVEGDVGARGRTADVSASFGDIVDASDSIFAFSGRLELGYGPVAGFVDGIYSDLGADDQSGPVGLADIDITFKQGIIDFGLMYRIIDTEPSGEAAKHRRNLTLDLYAGARYNSLELELDPANAETRSGSEDWLDPIIGAKLILPIAESWSLELNGDVGGFGVESDFTWSATAVVGYDFSLFGLPATVLGGYRAIGWDYSEGAGESEFVFDVVQHGPMLGLVVSF